MSAEGSFLVLGLDGTLISSGGDLQGDDRFVLLWFQENDCWSIVMFGLSSPRLVFWADMLPAESGVQQPSSSWSRLQAKAT